MTEIIDLTEHRQRAANEARLSEEATQQMEQEEREAEIAALRETLFHTMFRLEVLGHSCKPDLFPTEKELKVEEGVLSRVLERLFFG